MLVSLLRRDVVEDQPRGLVLATARNTPTHAFVQFQVLLSQD